MIKEIDIFLREELSAYEVYVISSRLEKMEEYSTMVMPAVFYSIGYRTLLGQQQTRVFECELVLTLLVNNFTEERLAIEELDKVASEVYVRLNKAGRVFVSNLHLISITPPQKIEDTLSVNLIYTLNIPLILSAQDTTLGEAKWGQEF